ncbi:MAG: nitroreductase [Comamonadaceae bacterium CG_4_9_14_3_um_filter_60_33]|nr:MAG: nitroreductase [Comamonadaceae bacterium CG_4_9_14_3_um_filter_60_33]
MNTLTKMALGLLGQLKPEPAQGEAADTIVLPAANMSGGMPLMQALAQRQSQREFAPEPLPQQMLSNLLWAAAGLNRPALGGRTVPSALNAQEVDIYVALDLIMVADYARMKRVPVAQRMAYAHTCAGAMAQNVYLYCASEELATVIRAWLDRDALAKAMGLGTEQQVLLSQTVGRKAPYPLLSASAAS